ncbi:MAG: UMP kinase [Candidatus Cloacimonadota bacterium]|nr:UMP kinase [Candidatus Cloacimonadota bacterium]
MNSKPKRILLKLSGEILQGDRPFGLSNDVVTEIVREIIKIHEHGFQIAVVIGAGNFFRGVSEMGNFMSRTEADNIGMLATIQNSIALKEKFLQLGVNAGIYTSRQFGNIGKVFSANLVNNALDNGQVAIFGGGIGNPFFTTDTTAVLRALEINATMVLKGTKVDGIFDKDPVKNDDAIFYPKITYDEYIKLNLRVMDLTAISLARENKLPIKVFNVRDNKNISKAVFENDFGSIIQ